VEDRAPSTRQSSSSSAGGLRFEQRPYVVMVNQAFVDLGVVKD